MSTANQQPVTSPNGKQPIAQHLAHLQAKRQLSPALPPKKSESASTDSSGKKKTLFDWLQLLAALAIPLVVAGASIWFSYVQYQLSDQQHQSDRQIANDQQQETALKAYLDDMSTLLLTYKLSQSQEQDEVRQVARAKTLTVLHHLNNARKGSVVQFLYEAQLISKKNPIVNLANADLRGADLRGADLSGADLRGADLHGADLHGADLNDADLYLADLSGADLNETYLSGANLFGAHLRDANLFGADLRDANLNEAYLSGAHLSYADLRGADLRYADLHGADLFGAHLRDAGLYGAHLSYADLSGADLSYTDLSGTDLRDTKLQDIISFSTRN